MTRNICITLSYLGTPFSGWQKTGTGTSIQEIIEDALGCILRERVCLQAASRTDAGVHAQGQVVNFLTESPIALSLLKRALNGTLPLEIRVLSIEEKEISFHPTLHCLEKEYRYHICNVSIQLPFYRHTSWHVRRPLNVEKMQRGAQALLGTHDFSSFCNKRAAWDRDLVCTLKMIEITPLNVQRLCIRIVGSRFLYNMVRIIVGTCVYWALGKLEATDFSDILQKRDRTCAGITAPSYGLTLHRVHYDLP